MNACRPPLNPEKKKKLGVSRRRAAPVTASCVFSSVNMNVAEAKSELKRLLSRLRPAELTQLLGWMKNSGKHAARVAWASWVTASAGDSSLCRHHVALFPRSRTLQE